MAGLPKAACGTAWGRLGSMCTGQDGQGCTKEPGALCVQLQLQMRGVFVPCRCLPRCPWPPRSQALGPQHSTARDS